MGETEREESEEATPGGTKNNLPGVKRSGLMSALGSCLIYQKDLDQVTRCPEASFDSSIRNAIWPSGQL